MTDAPLTSAQVAARLGVIRVTVHRWLRAGCLRGVKVGRQWRISAEEVERVEREGLAIDIEHAQ